MVASMVLAEWSLLSTELLYLGRAFECSVYKQARMPLVQWAEHDGIVSIRSSHEHLCRPSWSKRGFFRACYSYRVSRCASWCTSSAPFTAAFVESASGQRVLLRTPTAEAPCRRLPLQMTGANMSKSTRPPFLGASSEFREEWVPFFPVLRIGFFFFLLVFFT